MSALANSGLLTLGEALAIEGIERREAGYLLRAVTGYGAAHLVAHAEERLQPGLQQRFQELVRRRSRGEPLAYLIGVREFYGLEFEVTPAVLIPRPETELLVELALQRLPGDQPCTVLDLGTGSGAIALTLAALRPSASVIAVDASAPALEITARNCRRLGLASRVALQSSDWFAAVKGKRFDLIVSNPPYVPEGDPHLSEGDLRFEPRQALIGGRDGLEAIRRIVGEAPAYLAPGGWLLLEHGHDQAPAVRELLSGAGFESLVEETDLAGQPRVAGGRLTAS